MTIKRSERNREKERFGVKPEATRRKRSESQDAKAGVIAVSSRQNVPEIHRNKAAPSRRRAVEK
jgi:hypothetical protein